MSSQLPVVPSVTDVDSQKQRLRVHTQIVASILNSLVRLGILTRTGDDAWSIPGATGGTVTSVSQTVPVEFSIAGSPITTSGTLAITKATQSANRVWAGPTTGAAAQPTFRALVAADMPAGTGTVTSVSQTVPAEFSIAGSPITTSGTLAITKATQTANTIWAGPVSGGVAQPAFRALVTADLPAGAGSPLTTKGDLYGFSTVNVRVPVGTDGLVLTADSTATPGVSWQAASGAMLPLVTGETPGPILIADGSGQCIGVPL